MHAAEFSGQIVRPKNYGNGHKNIFGLSIVLELKVKNGDIKKETSFFFDIF